MKYFNALIKPASSLCNLKCKYCFYHDISLHRDTYSHGIMSKETTQKIIDHVLDYFKEDVMITFAFQGGEPTCAGLDYFKYFVLYLNERKKDYHHISYCIQTNATLIDDNWLAFLEENHFLVGISLDGYRLNHDYYRLNQNNQGTYKQVMNTIQKMKKRKIDFNILTVLTSQLSKHSQKLFNFYKENDLKNIQLIPCLNEIDKDTFSLKPHEFFKFYDQLFPLWYQEYQKGNYISFNYFDNLFLLFSGRYPYQCGYLGYCSMQFVIESDGSVYPCDFYCLDDYFLGNIVHQGIDEIIQNNILFQFINEKKRMSKICDSCRFIGICHGQCKRQNISYFDENYCALYEFMNKYEKEINIISNQLA